MSLKLGDFGGWPSNMQAVNSGSYALGASWNSANQKEQLSLVIAVSTRLYRCQGPATCFCQAELLTSFDLAWSHIDFFPHGMLKCCLKIILKNLFIPISHCGKHDPSPTRGASSWDISYTVRVAKFSSSHPGWGVARHDFSGYMKYSIHYGMNWGGEGVGEG